ncbi:MAG TPA: cell division protein ZipA C-terminal FtsZ-binding domain-containing protein [Acidiferrobacterales bacterium]|nr:cell division protein ZipA C-terminal FtsZ-binding domain-containing protein [Acidiferrobacterales bacterium]
MELQLALLLIGCIIVGVVALTAYERARFSRRRLAAGSSAAETPAVITRVRHAPAASGLDINPGPPHELGNNFLKSDAAATPVPAISPDAALHEELNDFEQAALMPLDLSLGLQDPDALAARGGNRQNMPDENIDYVVTLPGKGPVIRDKALGIYKQNEYLLEKPRHLYGLGYKTGLWSNLETDPEHSQYRSIALAIQMVDSKGPIGESELNTFTQLTLKLADALQRPTKFSMPFEEALEKARELDEFCETNDVLASNNILANGPTGFSGRAIDEAARQFGLQFGAMNIYHKKNDQALGCRHLFSLANLYQPGEFDPAKLDRFRTQGLTLFMNVPCAYQPVRVFEQMMQIAKKLCEKLDGRLEDHEHHLLTDPGLMVIRTQIERITAEMTNRGIIPGSATAMRLFS